MLKYDKSKSQSQRNERVLKTTQKKTHLERKAQSKNTSFQIDLSKKAPETELKKKKRYPNQLEVPFKQQLDQQQNRDSNSILDDSLLKSPISTSRDQDSSAGNTLTVKKMASPGIISGRLTIKSITNLDNSANANAFSQETKRTEFKAQMSHHAKSANNATLIASSAVHTPFDASPIKPFSNELIMEESNEKLRAPVNQKGHQLYNGNYHSDQNYKSKGQPNYNSKNEKYKDLVAKGQHINKERDSLILKTKKERDSSEGMNLLIIQKGNDEQLFETFSHQKQRNSPLLKTQSDDEDECPSLSPVSTTKKVPYLSNSASDENRFSVRQFRFNLISSLMGSPQTRTSFVSRASNRLMKNNYSSNSSQVTNKRNSHNCPKPFKSLFNCCGIQNTSDRNKAENSSVYSNGSAFNKVLHNNNFNNGSSFNQRLSKQSILNTEDFSDEVDEYENDQNNHRLSLVKRKSTNQTVFNQPGLKIREQAKPINIPTKTNQQQHQQKKSKLDSLVTKMPMNGIPSQTQSQTVDIQSIQVNLTSTNSFQNTNTVVNVPKNNNDDSMTNSSAVAPQDIHRLHFLQTIQALHTIKNVITMPSEKEIEHLKVNLPPLRDKKKTLIFDMDETLIHCVDDIDAEDPDVIIPIDFPDEEELVNAGVNIRPYIYECLEEAKKHFQVIVFTASHKAYADAILDHLDPENKYFEYRLYRDNCVQTKEGYYVKDLRIIRNRDLKDVVIIDNSVFSFSFHIDNGIPIIPFYADKEDEEMLHLIYYLNCLVNVDDVREQNREAFELRKLQGQSPYEIINNYYTTNNQQQMLLQNNTDNEDIDRDIIIEENEETYEILSEDENSVENGSTQRVVQEKEDNIAQQHRGQHLKAQVRV